MIVRAGLALAAITGLVGCNSASRVVGDPQHITLKAAMLDTMDALDATAAAARAPGRTLIGFYPCTMKATFNISATGTTTDKGGITAGGGVSGVTITGDVSREDVLGGTRGNVVEVVFATGFCLPEQGSTPSAAAGAPRAKGVAGSRSSPVTVSGGPTNPLPVLRYPDILYAGPQPKIVLPRIPFH